MVNFPTAGTQVFIVHGQTCHNSYSLNSESKELRKYRQLYVMDNELENNIKLDFKIEIVKTFHYRYRVNYII